MILDEIAASTRKRVDALKAKKGEEIKKKALSMCSDTGFPFEAALKRSGVSFICEVKKASPSKGIIVQEFDYLKIAADYQAAGADALSVLTEPEYFKGSDEILSDIAKTVDIPILRKDFTIDSYQIYEAKTIGASAVLLICALLSADVLSEYIGIAHSLGLSALVEAHDENEVCSALGAGARIIGVNNRNLKDFTVDINNSVRLRKSVPKEILYVSESGIKTREDISALEQNGTNAVLIGETLMRSADKKSVLDGLRGA